MWIPPVKDPAPVPPARDTEDVARRGGIFVVGAFLGRGMMVASTLVLAWVAAPETLGAFFFGLALLQATLVVACLGQDTLVLRVLPALEKNAQAAAQRRVWRALGVGCASAGVLTLGLEALLYVWQPTSQEGMRTAAVMGAGLIFHVAHRILAMTTLAREKTFWAMVVRQWLFPLTFLVLGPVSQGVGLGGGLAWATGGVGLALAYSASAAVAALGGLLLLHRQHPQQVSVTPQPSPLLTEGAELPAWGTLVRQGLPIMGAASLGHGLLWLDSFLVGALCPLDDVGRYGVVVRVGMVGLLLLDAFNSALGPAVGRLQQDLQAIAHTYAKAARAGFLLFLPVLGVSLLAPGWVLGWFGPQYSTPDARLALQLLVLGQAVNVATGGSGLMLVLLGEAGMGMRNSLMTFILLVLAWTGVALTVETISLPLAAGLAAGAIALLNILRGLQLYRLFGIHPFVRG